jgi:hypothetical protein
MGGVIVVTPDTDFRQTLSVVLRETLANGIAACIMFLYLWFETEKFSLKKISE